MTLLKTMKEDFLKFSQTNPLYFIASIIYFFLAAESFPSISRFPIGYVIAAILYFISLGIVFSPLGEKILRFLERVRKLETKEEKEYLLPLFEEVYEQAKQQNPELGEIELCVIDRITVNACAIGKHTIAVTKGAMKTFKEDELKALMAHEIAHILYGDTIAKLYTVIGNGLFTIYLVALRTVLAIVDFVQTLYKRPGSERLLVIIIRLILDLMIFFIMSLMQAVVAINSRKNEYRADHYASTLGYGEGLLKALYLLEKMKLGDNSTIIQRMTASHPRITARIEQLETLLDEETAMQMNPLPLS